MFPFNRRSRGHGDEFREVAGALGLAYEEGKVEVPRELSPGAPLFERWVVSENRLSGTIDGAAAAMFDLTTIRGTGEGESRRTWTVILFSQSRLPVFVYVPRSWTTWVERATISPISFDRRGADQITRQTIADFEKAYVLGISDTAAASAEDPVRSLFCAPKLEAMAQHPGWYVQSADGLLVFALSGIAAAADRPALWHEAVGLRRALLAPVSHAVTPIPAAPMMDVGRQRNRRAGRRAGGLAGTVVGFFGCFIAIASVLSPRVGPKAAGFGPAQSKLFLATFGIGMPSSLVVCAIAGAWLGGRVADLRYRPAPGCAPAPRISKGWVAAGAVLGWLVGGAIGMGLSAVFVRGVRDLWLQPILFFSPPVLCLVLGGFAGLAFALRRAAERTGK